MGDFERRAVSATPAGELVETKFSVVPQKGLDRTGLAAWESYLALGLTDDELESASLWTCRMAEELDQHILEHFQEEEVVLAAFSLLTLADATIGAVVAGIDIQAEGDGDAQSQA